MRNRYEASAWRGPLFLLALAASFGAFGWQPLEAQTRAARQTVKRGVAAEAFDSWVEAQRASGRMNDPSVWARGVELARQRATEMKSLVAADPEAFVRLSMEEGRRAQLPAAIQSLVEKRVRGRGSFSTYCILPTSEPAEDANGHRHGPSGFRA